MPIRKGNHSKRRYRYFRECSKRDPWISQKEEGERYDMVICKYCEDCLEKYNLSYGRVPRQLGICGICGNDGFIKGSLYNSAILIISAKERFKNGQ